MFKALRYYVLGSEWLVYMKYLVVFLSFGLSLSILADTVVYGRAHLVLNKTNDSVLNLISADSYVGLKGVNNLEDGLAATHQLEFKYDFTDSKKKLLVRRNWLGVKGQFGEFRAGLQSMPYDAVDDVVDFLQYSGHGLHTISRPKNVLSYLKKSGSFGFAASYVAKGGLDDHGETDLLLNYSTYPLYAGISYKKISSGEDGIKLALAIRDSNYAIGLVSEKQAITGNKINTLSGKYMKENYWLAGQYGKNHSTGDSQKNIEIGYRLSKKLKSYYEWGNIKGIQSNRFGLVHDY